MATRLLCAASVWLASGVCFATTYAETELTANMALAAGGALEPTDASGLAAAGERECPEPDNMDFLEEGRGSYFSLDGLGFLTVAAADLPMPNRAVSTSPKSMQTRPATNSVPAPAAAIIGEWAPRMAPPSMGGPPTPDSSMTPLGLAAQIAPEQSDDAEIFVAPGAIDYAPDLEVGAAGHAASGSETIQLESRLVAGIGAGDQARGWK